MPSFSKALTSDVFTDIMFCVNGENIPAHKVFLYCGSSVFATMFDGPLAPQCVNGEKPVIPINDEKISAAHFKDFLLFLYGDTPKITGDNAFTLMNLGKMYDVKSLAPLVTKFLIENLTSDNVVTVANSASVFGDTLILRSSIDFIVRHSNVLKSEEKFCQLNEQVLSMVLNKDEGNLFCHSLTDENGMCHICDKPPRFRESKLFQMLIKWGENQCKIKEIEPTPENLTTVLKEFLPLIRFPTISVDKVLSVVYPTKLFDDATMLNILVDAQNYANGQPSNKSGFSHVKRKAYNARAHSQKIKCEAEAMLEAITEQIARKSVLKTSRGRPY